MTDTVSERAARSTPPLLAGRVRGLSDRTIAWIFVAPTMDGDAQGQRGVRSGGTGSRPADGSDRRMSTATYPTQWRGPPQILKHRGWRIAIQVGFMIWLVLALLTIDANWARVAAGWERGLRFIGGFLDRSMSRGMTCGWMP
jgi:hypothetical protein